MINSGINVGSPLPPSGNFSTLLDRILGSSPLSLANIVHFLSYYDTQV